MARNEPGKAGPKGKPKALNEAAAKFTRMEEQWQWAWDEFQLRREAMERSGRVSFTEHGEKTHPNALLADRAAVHLLNVSRAWAALSPPTEKLDDVNLVVLDFQEKRKVGNV